MSPRGLCLCLLLCTNLLHAQNQPCTFSDSIDISHGEYDNTTGEVTFNGLTYMPNGYVIIDQRTVPIYRACKLHKFVRLCCPLGERLEPNGFVCVPNGLLNMRLTVFDTEFTHSYVVNLTDVFTYKTGKPFDSHLLQPGAASDEWFLLEDGMLNVEVNIYDADEYCLSFADNVSESNVIAYVSGIYEVTQNLNCTINPYAMISTIPFLLSTFSIYAILPELRNTLGKSLMCSLSGLSAAYALFAYTNLSTDQELNACKAIGYATYYAFLCSLFWLNVISFDLWKGFSGVMGQSQRDNTNIFWFYCVYAFGGPAVLVGLCYLIDHSSFIPIEFLPQIGIESCFVRDEYWIRMAYICAPVLLISITNTAFFVITTHRIRKVQRDIDRAIQTRNSQRHLNKEKFKIGLFLRMFLIMGIPWFLVGVSEMFGTWDVLLHFRWFALSDILLIYQAPCIFIMFIMKPKVKARLVERWNLWCGGVRSKGTHSRTETSV